MQTTLSEQSRQLPRAAEAEKIIRTCVHCGFCHATCPTYQLPGEELDGPRGRIYLIKQVLEGAPPTAQTQLHLDRCLSCRNCETTCPSGVQYSHLLEIGKQAIENELPRPAWDRLRRWGMVRFINSGKLFALTIRVGQALAWMLPAAMRQSIPLRQTPVTRTTATHPRKVLMLAGCVQPALAPNTTLLAANLLDRLALAVIEPQGKYYCGPVAAPHTDPD